MFVIFSFYMICSTITGVGVFCSKKALWETAVFCNPIPDSRSYLSLLAAPAARGKTEGNKDEQIKMGILGTKY